MRFTDRYPIFSTAHKDRCRDFWAHHLGFEVGFDSAWFVADVRRRSASIAFMTPDHPSAPPGPEPSRAKACVQLQVHDVARHTGRRRDCTRIDYPLRDDRSASVASVSSTQPGLGRRRATSRGAPGTGIANSMTASRKPAP